MEQAEVAPEDLAEVVGSFAIMRFYIIIPPSHTERRKRRSFLKGEQNV